MHRGMKETSGKVAQTEAVNFVVRLFLFFYRVSAAGGLHHGPIVQEASQEDIIPGIDRRGGEARL